MAIAKEFIFAAKERKPKKSELGDDGHVKDCLVRQPCNHDRVCPYGHETIYGSCSSFSCHHAQPHRDRSGRPRRNKNPFDKECVFPLIVREDSKLFLKKYSNVSQEKRVKGQNGKMLTVEIENLVVNCICCGNRIELTGTVSLTGGAARVVCSRCGEIHYLDIELSIKTKDLIFSSRQTLLELIEEEKILKEINANNGVENCNR